MYLRRNAEKYSKGRNYTVKSFQKVSGKICQVV